MIANALAHSHRRAVTLATTTALFGGMLIALFFVAPARPAAAQPADDDIASVDVELLGSIPWDATRPIDAQVTVTTRRALSGTLTVTDSPEGGATTTWQFDIDQAASTEVSLPVQLMTGWEGVRATARIEAGGVLIAEETVRFFPQGDASNPIVATLDIADPPAGLAQLGTGRQATVIIADDNPRLLARASSVISSPGAVRELGGSAAGESLETWVRGGGQLVIDGPPGSLDDRWHELETSNPNRFTLGAGSILYSTTWQAGIPIGGYGGQDQLRMLLSEQGFSTSATASELAALADFGLPRPRTISIVLVSYALLAGPILYLIVSRRDRHRRLWILLPALSAIVAAGILGVGYMNARGRTDAHITVVEVMPEGSRATSSVLVGSRLGTTRELAAPTPWRFIGRTMNTTNRPIVVKPGVGEIRVGVDLPPAGTSTLRFAGPAPQFDQALRIESIRRNDGGGLSAEVVNASGVDIHDAVAFLGNNRADIGDVGAGESATFSIDGGDRTGRMMGELVMWPRAPGGWEFDGRFNGRVESGGDDADASPVSAGAWTEWRVEQGTSAIPEHVIGVAGWSDQFVSPIANIELGNTALFVRVPVPADVLGDDWVSAIYEPTSQNVPPNILGEGFGWPQNYRFTVGPGISFDEMALSVAPEASSLSMLVDGLWQYATLPDGPGRDRVAISLPEGLEAGDEIVVQSWVGEWHWNAPRTVWLEPVAGLGGDGLGETSWGDQPVSRHTEPDIGDEFGPQGAFFEAVRVEVAEFGPGGSETFESFVEAGGYATYQVNLDSGQPLIATLHGLSGDPLLEVYGEFGELLAINDDFGVGLDSQVEFTAVADMTVEVRAQGLGGEPLDYRLTLESPDE